MHCVIKTYFSFWFPPTGQFFIPIFIIYNTATLFIITLFTCVHVYVQVCLYFLPFYYTLHLVLLLLLIVKFNCPLAAVTHISLFARLIKEFWFWFLCLYVLGVVVNDIIFAVNSNRWNITTSNGDSSVTFGWSSCQGSIFWISEHLLLSDCTIYAYHPSPVSTARAALCIECLAHVLGSPLLYCEVVLAAVESKAHSLGEHGGRQQWLLEPNFQGVCDHCVLKVMLWKNGEHVMSSQRMDPTSLVTPWLFH